MNWAYNVELNSNFHGLNRPARTQQVPTENLRFQTNLKVEQRKNSAGLALQYNYNQPGRSVGSATTRSHYYITHTKCSDSLRTRHTFPPPPAQLLLLPTSFAAPHRPGSSAGTEIGSPSGARPRRGAGPSPWTCSATLWTLRRFLEFAVFRLYRYIRIT